MLKKGYYGQLKSIGGKNVKINDSFWSSRLKVIRETTICDILDKFSKNGTPNNPNTINIFKSYNKVTSGEKASNINFPWYDGLLYETIRGISDFMANDYDERFDRKLDEYIELISKAQEADPCGYINTYSTLMCPENRWGEKGGNLLWQHELYNAGCLCEAGVHHYKATGKVSLLTVAVKMANYMCSEMGPLPRKNIVPAHPQPEEALVKLYRLFKDEQELKDRIAVKVDEHRYLELARFWIDTRGKHKGRVSYPRYLGEYAQDHRPILEQEEAVGHAVRAALLYNGIINVAMETGDEKYFQTALKLWENVVGRKYYISGGIGSTQNEEKFGPEYQLPDNGYLETCAAVAMAFWGESMKLAFGDARFIEPIERNLYNNILSGLSLSGTKYFYENPLVSDGNTHRWEWHACPCCPPMFLKIMGELNSYIYSIDKYGVYVNLFIGSTAKFDGFMEIEQNTKGPWYGSVEFVVRSVENPGALINIRLPEWSGKFCITVNGEEAKPVLKKGYLVLNRNWQNGDVIKFDMEMPVTRVEAHPYVVHLGTKVALQRGPFLYCAEGVDNNGNVDIVIKKSSVFSAQHNQDLLAGVTVITGEDKDGKKFVTTPYFAWDNREAGKMAVWFEQEGKSKDLCLDGWENLLYRKYEDKK